MLSKQTVYPQILRNFASKLRRKSNVLFQTSKPPKTNIPENNTTIGPFVCSFRLQYIERQNPKSLSSLGINDTDKFLSQFGNQSKINIIEGRFEEKITRETVYIGSKMETKVEGFNTIDIPSRNDSNDLKESDNSIEVQHLSIDGALYIKQGKRIFFRSSEKELADHVLRQHQYNLNSYFTESDVKRVCEEGLIYRNDSPIVKISESNTFYKSPKFQCIIYSDKGAKQELYSKIIK